jgi:hypothetical protein
MRLSSMLVVLLAGTAWAQPRDTAALLRCKEQAAQCARSLVTNDHQKFLSCMPPKLLALVGGAEAMLKLLDSTKKDMLDKGIEIASAKVQAPPRLYTRGPDSFALVPMTIVINTPEGKLVQESYMLALSSDRGRKWLFLDGAKLSDPRAKEVLPPLPPDLVLPPRREPTLLAPPPDR